MLGLLSAYPVTDGDDIFMCIDTPERIVVRFEMVQVWDILVSEPTSSTGNVVTVEYEKY